HQTACYRAKDARQAAEDARSEYLYDEVGTGARSAGQPECVEGARQPGETSGYDPGYGVDSLDVDSQHPGQRGVLDRGPHRDAEPRPGEEQIERDSDCGKDQGRGEHDTLQPE